MAFDVKNGTHRSQYHNQVNLFKMRRNHKKTQSKSKQAMENIAIWIAYYRANPHRFVLDFLGVNLRPFQCVLLWAMMHNEYFMFIAARGLGKTFLSAIYCVTRCVLYPGTKIVITAPSKNQGIQVLLKIESEIMSPLLAREIDTINTGFQKPSINFHNGSWIKVAASNDNARGLRANLLLVDEFVKVDLDVIDSVFRKMLSSQREPKFYSKPEYANYPREENMEMYLSSAWMKSHWGYNMMKSFTKQMLINKAKGSLQYFVCHIPYYTTIKEKLLSQKKMISDAQQENFNEMKLAVEMEARWWGESESAFFNFNKIDMNRKLNQAFYPKEVTEHTNIKNPIKEPTEKRILAVDVARMGGNANDASVFSLIRLVNKDKYYERQLCYMQDMVGIDFETQAIRVQQLFHDFDCDYIALDSKNVGMGVLDGLMRELSDPQRGIEYDPLNVMNDDELASTSKFPDAKKVIYVIKATNELNMKMAENLQDSFMRGRFRLLIQENQAEENFINDKKIKYNDLQLELKTLIRYPYRQIEYFIEEAMNLEQVVSDNGTFKLVTQGTARKDRYSSVSMGNHLATELERELVKKTKGFDPRAFGSFRKPKSII